MRIPHTVSVHYWLLGYHFTDTLLLFTRGGLTILSSSKKCIALFDLDKILTEVEPLMKKSAIGLRLVVKEKGAEASLKQLEALL